jgi:hypothetical protein
LEKSSHASVSRYRWKIGRHASGSPPERYTTAIITPRVPPLRRSCQTRAHVRRPESGDAAAGAPVRPFLSCFGVGFPFLKDAKRSPLISTLGAEPRLITQPRHVGTTSLATPLLRGRFISSGKAEDVCPSADVCPASLPLGDDIGPTGFIRSVGEPFGPFLIFPLFMLGGLS